MALKVRGLSDETPLIALWPGGFYYALDKRTFLFLLRQDIRTVGALTGTMASDLMKLPNFGEAMLGEVCVRLAEAGLSLRGETDVSAEAKAPIG